MTARRQRRVPSGQAWMARGRPPQPDRNTERSTRDPRQLQPAGTPALRLADVAGRLAISRAAAYRLVRAGQLPGIRIGTSWRVLQVDFDAYLDRMRSEAERRYRRVRGR